MNAVSLPPRQRAPKLEGLQAGEYIVVEPAAQPTGVKTADFKGFSLLVETPGIGPDTKAANLALSALCKFLNLKIDLSRIDSATEETKRVLESFGLIGRVKQEEKKEESHFRWFV